MTSCALEPEALRALAPDLAGRDAAQVASLLSPWLERMREPFPPDQVKQAVDAASAVCRALYDQGRSFEALPLARELIGACRLSGSRAQTRRALGVCGILSADCTDLVSAVECHAHSLRIAVGDDDRLEMARIWTLIGNPFHHSGRFELASRCFQRAHGLLVPVSATGAVAVRNAALANLADTAYHSGQLAEGLAYAEAALREEATIAGQDAHAAVILRRTLVRLMLALERPREAARFLEQAVAISGDSPSPRIAIAVDMMRVAIEIATDQADIALSRLDRTLARARRVPPILQDALAYAVRAEEAAGNPGRALMRLQELSEHVYGFGLDRTRRMIDLAGIDGSDGSLETHREQDRARLASKLDSLSAPQGWSTLRRLGASAALRMDDTGWHGVRAGALARALALTTGSTPLEALEIGLAAELHDIGMGTVPAGILAKSGPLNDSERAVVRKHAEGGAEMLVDDSHPRLLMARDIARFHHARWDGLGYPARVAWTAIPLAARICSVADAYDMMVCGFGGRTPMSLDAALAELRREAGGQFDPGLVSCFDALVKGELEALGVDPSSGTGMETFQELILSLKEDRGFV
jgi:putative two-component system response regulator